MGDTGFVASAAFGGYRLLGLVGRWVAPFVLSYRARRGKEDPARLGERYGDSSVDRPAGQVIWIHAASVGEINAVVPLIERIVATGASVVMTSVTVTGASVAADRLPDGACHQYSPIDAVPWIQAFLRHWRPDCAIFVESEIWPETIRQLSAAGIPRIVVNGRLSPRSFANWRRHPRVAHALFSQISLCLAQSERDAEHYSALGVASVAVSGNLKFDTPPPAADPIDLATLKAVIGRRPIWVAASTHDGEEAMIAAAHCHLAAARPRLLTIIAPRHPSRGPTVAAMLKDRGLAVARRGAGESITPSVDIYLADTLGELGLLYRAVPVAFIGGSLIAHGGQNPIEPLQLGTAVLHGPHVDNFAEVYAAVDDADPGCLVADTDSLADAVGTLLADPAACRDRAAIARAALAPFSGGLERTIEALKPYLKAEAPEETGAEVHQAAVS